MHKADHCWFEGAVIIKLFELNIADQLEQEAETATISDIQKFQSLTHNVEIMFQIFFWDAEVRVVGKV